VLCCLKGPKSRIETLVTLTLHRFAPRYDAGLPVAHTMATAPDTLPIPLWPALGLRTWTRDAARAALCPLCWRDQRALLLPWSLRHVTACSRHRVLLIDRCTRCRALVTPDVRLSACRQCGQDIGALPTHSIAEEPDSLAVTALIWSAIGCLPGSFPPATIGVSADHPLRRVGTASMLHGLWACAQRHVGHTLHKMALPHPGLATDERVPMLADERTGGQVIDLLAVDRVSCQLAVHCSLVRACRPA